MPLESMLVESTGPLPWKTAGRLVNTMTFVNPDLVFNWERYARRDKELLGRDLVAAAALSKLAATISLIWNSKPSRPIAPAPAKTVLPDNAADRDNVVSAIGSVAHVIPSSHPYAAVDADKDLYGRDLLIVESAARAAEILTHPPIDRIDPGEAIAPTISSLWSLAEESSIARSINPTLLLNVDFFKDPDTYLAGRDNDLAACAAQLEATLENPFESANRLLVQITGTDAEEPELYVIDSDQTTDHMRVFVAEPHLPGRMRLEYDVDQKKVRWVSDSSTVLHTSQPQPYVDGDTAVIGPVDGQNIVFVPSAPTRQDSAFYYQKASRLNFNPVLETTVFNDAAPAHLVGLDAALFSTILLTQPKTITMEALPCAIVEGVCKVSCLVRPTSVIDYPTGSLVGSGITHSDGNVVFPSSGGTAILPIAPYAGTWDVTVTYENVGSTTPNEYPVIVELIRLSDNQTTTLTTVPFRGTATTTDFSITVNGSAYELHFSWTPPDASAQLAFSRVTLVNSKSTKFSVGLQASLWNGSSIIGEVQTMEVAGVRGQPAVLEFDFGVATPVSGPNLRLEWFEGYGDAAIVVEHLHITTLVSASTTPNADGFESFPAAMLRRALRSVQDSFKAIPTLVDPRIQSGSQYLWTVDSTKTWTNQIRTIETRLDTAFRLAGPADIGKPVLLPAGLEYVVGLGVVIHAGSAVECVPQLSILQPWMLYVQPLVAKEVFTS